MGIANFRLFFEAQEKLIEEAGIKPDDRHYLSRTLQDLAGAGDALLLRAIRDDCDGGHIRMPDRLYAMRIF